MKGTSRTALLFILFSSLCAGIGQLFWKKASFSLAFTLQGILNPFLIAGVLFYGLATLSMILSFREGELSVLHPFLATSYLWVTLISPVYFVSESLTYFKILGVVFIFLGVSAIGIGGRKSNVN